MLKILLVDDEPGMREAIKEHIRLRLGDDVQIEEAKDGLEASSKLHFDKFTSIITDMNMPRLNGQEFIENIRKSQLNADTQIIVISGHITPDQFQDENITLLSKPFDFKKLIELIAK